MNSVPVYCINLKSRPDRWKRFTSQPGVRELEKTFRFERVEAVVGKEIDIQNDSRISVRTKRNILFQKRRDHEDLDSPGAIGCYLSHAMLWKKFLESNEECCIILEDDAVVPKNFIQLFQLGQKNIKELSVNQPILWQLSKPHTIGLRNALGDEKVRVEERWIFDATSPTTGYVLFRDTAKVLLDNAYPIDGHVDMYMRRCSQIGMIRIVHFRYLLLGQVAVKRKDTDIQMNNCELCDLPTNLSKSNLQIVTQEHIFSTTLVILGLASLLAIQYFHKKA